MEPEKQPVAAAVPMEAVEAEQSAVVKALKARQKLPAPFKSRGDVSSYLYIDRWMCEPIAVENIHAFGKLRAAGQLNLRPTLSEFLARDVRGTGHVWSVYRACGTVVRPRPYQVAATRAFFEQNDAKIAMSTFLDKLETTPRASKDHLGYMEVLESWYAHCKSFLAKARSKQLFLDTFEKHKTCGKFVVKVKSSGRFVASEKEDIEDIEGDCEPN